MQLNWREIARFFLYPVLFFPFAPQHSFSNSFFSLFSPRTCTRTTASPTAVEASPNQMKGLCLFCPLSLEKFVGQQKCCCISAVALILIPDLLNGNSDVNTVGHQANGHSLQPWIYLKFHAQNFGKGQHYTRNEKIRGLSLRNLLCEKSNTP